MPDVNPGYWERTLLSPAFGFEFESNKGKARSTSKRRRGVSTPHAPQRRCRKSFIWLALEVPITSVHCPYTKVANIIFETATVH